jgi:nucleoside-diphosphate-sugar epimerase
MEGEMKAFVTGGTGFIGKRLVRKLIDRDYEVSGLARSLASQQALVEMGVQPVPGDLDNIEALRTGMKDVDVVFHLAGWYKLGGSASGQAEHINVDGTRHVLETAFQMGVPKIVHVSTVAVYGDTRGIKIPVDETVFPPAGPLLTDYDRTKWKAHVEVALPLIKQGAPIVIMMPGVVYGPDDPSLIGQLMQAYYRGLFPMFPGPETTLTLPYVDDVAEGLILGAEKGKPGESYIITGPAISFEKLVPLWSLVSGKSRPLAYIPASFLHPFIPFVEELNDFIELPELISGDSLRVLGAYYVADSSKARRELGWETRTLEQGMRETFNSMAEEVRPLLPLAPRQKRAVTLLALALGVLLGVWLVFNRKSKRG